MPAPVSNSPEQLVLPLPGVLLTPPQGLGIPRPQRVFVNRNLRMSGIEWVGFDMDYTLAIYRQDAMDALSIDLTVERLLRRGYPSYLRQLAYDTRFPIRGLLIDKRYGHILKMDRYKVVFKGYHGMRRMQRDRLQKLYHEKRIRPHLSHYHWIDTLFSLSEVTAYAAIIEALEARKESIQYEKLFVDVRAAIDEAHADGTVYRLVTADFERYVERDPDLAKTLHKLRSAGKRLFLLTNSPWHYTDRMMTFLLGEAMSEYPSWRHYFDVAICSAGKPAWFNERREFLERDGSEVKPVGRSLERGKVYEGGNLRDFEHLAQLRGSSVLYVGDHIYGDILRSKKESSWRTAMIIQELDSEIRACEGTLSSSTRRRELGEARDRLEDELRYYQQQFKELSRGQNGSDPNLQAERLRVKRALDRIRGAIRSYNREDDVLTEEIDRAFHPYWGSLLKEGHEMSSFGLQVDTYSDIYMRRVSCLNGYSPLQFFRSPHDLMPHEL